MPLHQHAYNPLRLCAALLLLGLLAATPTVAPAARAAAPSEGYDIPCDASPFGHVLNLGQKNEVFLGLKHMASDFPGSLYAYRLGAGADNGPLISQYVSDPAAEPANITALAGTAADLDGDGRAEFVQGYTDAGGGAYQVLVRKNGAAAQLHTESWPGHTSRAMAAGDVLALDNGSQQVAIASRAADGGLSVGVFGGAPGGGVGAPLAVWRSNTNNRGGATRIRVAVGNLDNDGYADIVLSLVQSDNRWGRQDATISAPPTIALGDWNNDSLRATVGGKCARVVDGNITAVGFVPPYWQNIQGGQQKGGSIGRSVSQEGSVETSLTYSRSQTVSAYVGVSAGASFFDLAEFSASAKATGAQEYATSNKRTTSTSTSTVTTVGQSWVDDQPCYFYCGSVSTRSNTSNCLCNAAASVSRAIVSSTACSTGVAATGRRSRWSIACRMR